MVTGSAAEIFRLKVELALVLDAPWAQRGWRGFCRDSYHGWSLRCFQSGLAPSYGFGLRAGSEA